MTHDELLRHLDEKLSWENSTEVGAAYSALRAVVELHTPYKTKHFGERVEYLACYHCEQATVEGDAYQLPYPCPTIQAIEKELA